MTTEQIGKSYSAQFRECNSNGTCRHMSREHHDTMPAQQKRAYRSHAKFMGLAKDYFGPRGPLYCGHTPGVCSSKHCQLI